MDKTTGINKSPIQGINCDATECIHNNHKAGCTAASIKVGCCSAKKCDETKCESFKAQTCC